MTSKQRMYKDTKTWNPFVGCRFQCVYCKPSFQKQVARVGRFRNCESCKGYLPHEHPERLSRMPSDKTIAVCLDGDFNFCPREFMERIFEVMRNDGRKGRVFLLQTKNPVRFNEYLPLLPLNTYLLTTLETNRDTDYRLYSLAPFPSVRYLDFKNVQWDKKIVTVEPIMDFDLDIFSNWIISIKPYAVFIGYNSRPKQVSIPEPSLRKTLKLFRVLKANGIRVLPKDMRGMSKYMPKKAYRDLFN